MVTALWIARRPPGPLRSLLPVLAVISIAADPIAGAWATTTSVPAFFTGSAYRTCLDPGQIVLPLPIGQGSAMIWQADSDFRFDIAGGYISATPPPLFTKPAGMAYVSGGSHLGPQQAGIVRAFIARTGVTAIVVEQDEAPFFSGALDGLATPETVGGVVLYRLGEVTPSC